MPDVLGWATAIAGAAPVLGGLGRIAPGTLGFLADSEKPLGQVLSTVALLTILTRGAQRALARDRTPETAA